MINEHFVQQAYDAAKEVEAAADVLQTAIAKFMNAAERSDSPDLIDRGQQLIGAAYVDSIAVKINSNTGRRTITKAECGNGELWKAENAFSLTPRKSKP
jgi:hypothetical protein